MRPGVTRRASAAGGCLLLALFVGYRSLVPAGAAPQTPAPASDFKEAQRLLRRGQTAEARRLLEGLRDADRSNAEIHYQIARSYLMDFHETRDPAAARLHLNLALEALDSALARNADHIYALRAKAVIHARAELLHYNPDLAYRLASRIARLQPHANEYLISLAEWMSGEVRFTGHKEHRVPHDPLIGLDRSIEILERVVDASFPHSDEEYTALHLLGKTFGNRGNFDGAVEHLRLALSRADSAQRRTETLRELGAVLYRMGDYGQAARTFYDATQTGSSLVDRWLLKVALDKWTEPPPPLPASALFPVAEPSVDAAHPPLIGFEDMAEKLGLNRLDGNGTCAWADYDGDGRLDLVLAGSGTFLALYRNEGEGFRETTEEAGLARVPSGYSLNWVDYDNDGRLDLYIALNGWSGPAPNRLFHNEGNGRFHDVTKESGAGDAGSGFVSLWGDLDNDGHVDFIVANGVLKDGSTPQIYRNNGNGIFANVTKDAGVDEPPSWGAIGVALGDYDRDGDLDVFVNGLGTAPNRLYRNDTGEAGGGSTPRKMRFTNVTRFARVQQPAHNGFVCFFFDYDNDGWPDLLTTSLAPWEATVQSFSTSFSVSSQGSLHPDAPRLFRNNRDGTFTDATISAHLYYPMGVMGAGVADLDNDGHLDLYFGTGDPQLSRLEPNRFFRNNGDGTFADLTVLTGFARPGTKGHGVTFVDIDGDGDLDVYAQLGGHYPGDHARNAFYRNLKGNRNNWMQIDLKRSGGNRFAVGAALVMKAAGLTLYREVKGGEGFGSTDPYPVHFGLGARTSVESLEIIWPGGRKQVFSGIPANQLIEITESSPTWRVLKKLD